MSNILLPMKNLRAQGVFQSETIPEVIFAIYFLEIYLPAFQISEFSGEPDDLPPMPHIFNGRESELSDLVNMFCQPLQAHAVLMGQGGAGKSSLALALMHQPEIKQQFRHQRLFVKCNSAKGSLDLLSRLGSALGLPDVPADTESSGYKEAIRSSLECSQVPCLIVFDDLGTFLLSPLSQVT